MTGGGNRPLTRELAIEFGFTALLAVGIIIVLVVLILLYKRWTENRFDG